MKIGRIMVAVDFSEHSPDSMRYAAGLAELAGAGIIVVNVINQRDMDAVEVAGQTATEISVERYLDFHKKERMKKMDALVTETIGPSAPVQKIVRVGVPHQQLLQVIAEEKPDVLVMSTKGRSNLTDVILGSTAERMFHRSPIPLLSLRPKQ